MRRFCIGVLFVLLFAVFLLHDFVAYGQDESGESGGPDVAVRDAPKHVQNEAADFVSRGLAKGQKDDFEGAIIEFSSAIKINPDDYYAFFLRAVALLARNDLSGAMADCNNAIRLKPDYAPAYVERGMLTKRSGNLEGAIADYSKAIKIDPKLNHAYQFRGSAREANNDLSGALADYDELIRLNPENAYYYISRGALKNDMGDWEGAMADSNKAMGLKPDSEAYASRAGLEMAHGDLDAAMADCNKAIELSATYDGSYSVRGNLKEKLGDMTGALADRNKAMQMSNNPTGNPFYWRGCLLFNMRKFPEALADFRKAAKLGMFDVLENDYPNYRIYLVRALQNENAEAAAELQAYLSKRKPESGGDWRLKIGLFLADRMPEPDFLSAADGKNGEKSKNRHCEAWFYAGMKHLIAGDKVTAVDYFKKCIATGQIGYDEYASAVANLKFLGGQ